MAEGPDDEDDDEGWEDDMDQTEGDSGVDGGRVRSDFHSGGGPGARFRPY
jgi:nucleotide-sensitive chloride channel 1A